MRASRPEDVDEILEKIEDKEDFNQRLRSLIFGKLIAGWRGLDGAEQMDRIGRLARWWVARKSVGLPDDDHMKRSRSHEISTAWES